MGLSIQWTEVTLYQFSHWVNLLRENYWEKLFTQMRYYRNFSTLFYDGICVNHQEAWYNIYMRKKINVDNAQHRVLLKKSVISPI